MLVDGETYAPSMVKFLNQYSRKCRTQTDEQNNYLLDLFNSFLEACQGLPEDAFLNKKNRRFNVALYEAAFSGACGSAFRERRRLSLPVMATRLAQLESDPEFVNALLEGTTKAKNVQTRLARARAILGVAD